MSYNDDRRKQRVKLTSSQHVSDWPDRTVQIEAGLRSRSPKNGNISNIGRRLSAVPGQKWLIPERGDRLSIRKSPPLAGISAITKNGFPESRTAWLGREDSNLRMVESKSDDTAMNFNAHSELSCFVRPLAVLMFFLCSEWKRARRLKTTFEELLSIRRTGTRTWTS